MFFYNEYGNILHRAYLARLQSQLRVDGIFFDDRFVLGEPDFYRPQADGRDAEDDNGLGLLFSYYGDL